MRLTSVFRSLSLSHVRAIHRLRCSRFRHTLLCVYSSSLFPSFSRAYASDTPSSMFTHRLRHASRFLRRLARNAYLSLRPLGVAVHGAFSAHRRPRAHVSAHTSSVSHMLTSTLVFWGMYSLPTGCVGVLGCCGNEGTVPGREKRGQRACRAYRRGRCRAAAGREKEFALRKTILDNLT